MENILYLIIGIIIFLYFYVSVLTGFFAIYYYNNKIYNNIKTKNIDSGYFSHILAIAVLFIINTCLTIFYNNIIGIIIYCILIVFAIIFKFVIKNNMKNIIEIYFYGARPPAIVKFKTKSLTILLSPISSGIFSIILFVIIFGIFFMILLFKKYGIL